MLLPAEEYKQRVAAGDWAAAHELFAEELAPRWWLSGQCPRVRSALQPLLQAVQEAQAEVGSGEWRTGAELYSAFFHLEVGCSFMLMKGLHSDHPMPCTLAGVHCPLVCAFDRVLSVAGILAWIPSGTSLNACRTCTRAGARSMMRTTQLLTAWMR